LIHYDEVKLRKEEDDLLNHLTNEWFELLIFLLEIKAYQLIISLMNTKIIFVVLSLKLRVAVKDLSSLFEF
jgi:hypothetical protein